MTGIDRRALLGAGASAAAGLWVAPSVLTLDRVAAATGTCGVKPVQVDMSAWTGLNVPSAFTANDGTDVTMSISDPSGVQSSSWDMVVYNDNGGNLNGLDNPAITGMTGASKGVGVSITFAFGTPRAVSFFLVEVDRSPGSWEDTVQVVGSLGGSPIDPASMVTGADVRQISANTVQGTAASNGASSNVEVDFQTAVDTVTIRHYDSRNWTAFQWIGIHDLHWC